MADQTFNVKCGFFDAVNNDRVYSADDMSLLFDRLVANGIFATPEGTPSTDLQILASGSSMNITVKKGAGIFANKWFRNTSDILITVPGNSAAYSRIDSVIVQVDLRTSGRNGAIVYRTGTPASTPEPPEINQISDVIEYRIANITVAQNATEITNANISDLRGSSECLWVTSLIQQVDTSTLWEQYNAAYAQQFKNYQLEFNEYIALQRQAWEEFLSTLTEELTVSTDVATYSSSYTALSTVSNIPINIISYDHQTDVLHVYINGLFAAHGEKYTLNENHTSIDLVNAIDAGNTVYFVVFKSLIGAGNQSVITLIEDLESDLGAYFHDSEWVLLTLQNGESVDAEHTPEFRARGQMIYLRGAIKGITSVNTVISTLPVLIRPGADHIITSCAVNNGTITASVQLTIEAESGNVIISALSEAISATDEIALNAEWLAGLGW